MSRKLFARVSKIEKCTLAGGIVHDLCHAPRSFGRRTPLRWGAVGKNLSRYLIRPVVVCFLRMVCSGCAGLSEITCSSLAAGPKKPQCEAARRETSSAFLSVVVGELSAKESNSLACSKSCRTDRSPADLIMQSLSQVVSKLALLLTIVGSIPPTRRRTTPWAPTKDSLFSRQIRPRSSFLGQEALLFVSAALIVRNHGLACRYCHGSRQIKSSGLSIARMAVWRQKPQMPDRSTIAAAETQAIHEGAVVVAGHQSSN